MLIGRTVTGLDVRLPVPFVFRRPVPGSLSATGEFQPPLTNAAFPEGLTDGFHSNTQGGGPLW
jgi:hypothetical protein